MDYIKYGFDLGYESDCKCCELRIYIRFSISQAGLQMLLALRVAMPAIARRWAESHTLHLTDKQTYGPVYKIFNKQAP